MLRTAAVWALIVLKQRPLERSQNRIMVYGAGVDNRSEELAIGVRNLLQDAISL